MRRDSESAELPGECQTGGVSPLDEHGSARSYLDAQSVLICIQSCQTTSSEDISD